MKRLPALPEPSPRRWGLGDAWLAIAASLLLPTVGFALSGLTADEVDRVALWVVVLLQIPLWIVLLGAPLLASRHKGTRSLRTDFGLEVRRGDVIVGLAIGVAAQAVLTVALLPLYHLLGIDPQDTGRAADDLAARAPDLWGWACLFVLVVVGAPLLEELFYRGLLLRAIAYRWGPVAGIVLSGLVFGALHFELAATIALSLFGMLAAWLTVRSGRLGPSIWAHVGFNLTTFVALVLTR